jgi:putative ABC transport system ATP-binding protein
MKIKKDDMPGLKKVIDVRQLVKIYVTGETSVEALRGVDLTISDGEFVAIMGASGSGKSTLMNILGCLDSLTKGEYFLDGVSVRDLSRNELADIRSSKIGFVFQGFNLLSRTTALDNVELPLLYNTAYSDGTSKTDSKKKSRWALENVGLGDRIHHFPNQLSGGQQQRVAIARALVNDPALILADEPTGNLDSKTSVEIMSIFQELNDEGITIILVTHEADIAGYAKRIVEFRDGVIIRDHPVEARKNATKDLKNIGTPL